MPDPRVAAASPWWKQLLTEVGNEVWDLKRVIAASGAALFHVLAGYDVFVLHHPFQMQDYGIAFGAILTAIGAAIGLGRSGENAPR